MAIPTTLIGSTSVLRNPSLDPLSDRQLKEFAPTIFAKAGIEGVSERYGHVSTIDIINAMRDSGFEPVEVRQSQRRDTERMPFTKHMLKFRPKGEVKKATVGDVIQQIVMLNSHDRSSGFHLYGGLWRWVCSNGLMVSDSELVAPIRVAHTTKMVADIVARSQELVKGADGVYRLRKDMLDVPMNDRQMLSFAQAALEFRPPRRSGVIEPKALLEPRRKEDDKPNLWHVFNRVQENMLRGGNETVTPEGRNVRTRGIGRIERDVEVNTRLWSLAVQTIEKIRQSSKKGAQTSTKRAPRKTIDQEAADIIS